MAPAFAAVLLPAAAVALMAMAALQPSSAAAAARPPAPIGLPGCQPRAPQLLLGDGSLWVAEISLSRWSQTVRVTRAGYIINATGDLTSPGWNSSLDFGRGFWEHGYGSRPELVLNGCNVMATFSVDIVKEETPKIVSSCSSFCTKSDREGGLLYYNYEARDKQICTGMSSCCLAPLIWSSVPMPNGVQAKWLYSTDNHTSDQTLELGGSRGGWGAG